MYKTGLWAVAALVSISVAAMAAQSSFEQWHHVGNAEFRDAMQKVVGADPVNCGLLDLVQRQQHRAEARKVLACIADARQRKVSFKYGTFRIPIDTQVYEVYLHSAAGEAWLFAYDLTPAESEFQMWFVKCQQVDVDADTLVITGEDCVEGRP
jgi:hypothetical protein